MSTYLSYSEIPKAERKRLGIEAYRQAPILRIIQFVAIVVSIVCGGILANHLIRNDGADLRRLGLNLGLRILFALMCYTIIWELFGRRRLKAEVEKLKNG